MALTAEDPEGRRNRSTDRAGHRLSARVTAFAAFVGVVSGLLASWLTASRDDARSERDFLRVQRISLYGEFLTKVDQINALLERVQEDYPPAGDPSGLAPVLPQGTFDEIASALTEFQNVMDRSRVLSGEEVREAGGYVHSDLRDGFQPYVIAADCADDPLSWTICPSLPNPVPDDVPTPPVDPAGLADSFASLADDRPNFLDRVHEELEIPE
jgi:hypothetical protein